MFLNDSRCDNKDDSRYNNKKEPNNPAGITIKDDIVLVRYINETTPLYS